MSTPQFSESAISNGFESEIEALVLNKEVFNNFIYTPLDEAVKELQARNDDKAIKSYLNDFLIAGIPKPFHENKCAVLFRQIATPNYEVRRFVSIVDALGGGFKPLFFEYLEDKFTDNNEWKYSLCKMSFFSGKGKKGGSKIERINVVDFNTFKGKKFSEITTFWGQKIGDFHRELVRQVYSHFEIDSFYDASGWFAKSGGSAREYYTHFLRLFLQNGVLFENFMIDQKELSFTKEVFLPAFMKILKDTGKKPLIVALEPTDIEGDEFWMCHPHTSVDYVKSKFNLL